MVKVKFLGPDDHIVIFLSEGLVKFKKDQIKEVPEIDAPKLLASPFGKFVKEEAEVKILPARGRNRQLAKAEVKDGSES
jgi:hypothetical protein